FPDVCRLPNSSAGGCGWAKSSVLQWGDADFKIRSKRYPAIARMGAGRRQLLRQLSPSEPCGDSAYDLPGRAKSECETSVRQYLFVDKLTWWAENLIINSAGFESTTSSFGFLQSAEVYDEH